MSDRNRRNSTTSSYIASQQGYVPPKERNRQQTQDQDKREAPPAPRREPQSAPKPRYTTAELILFAMVLFVLPLLGLTGILFSPLLWAFIVVAVGCLAVMWLQRCFSKGTRIAFTGLLAVLSVLGLLMNIDLTPKQQTGYPQVDGQFAVLGSQVQDPTAQPDPESFMEYAQGNAIAPTTQPDLFATVPEGGDEGQGNSTDGATEPAMVGINTDGAIVSSGVPDNPALSSAQAVLEGYLQGWSLADWDGMVKYTMDSWQKAQDASQTPKQALFFMHYWLTPINWTITPEAISASADSATFSVVIELKRSGSTAGTVRERYDALLFKDSVGEWKIDPVSMRAGVSVEDTPPPGVAAESEATPEPEPTIDPKTVLWYNSRNGSYYHAQEKCQEIGKDYYQHMKSFTYGELGDKSYSKLLRCPTCNAPERPQ